MKISKLINHPFLNSYLVSDLSDKNFVQAMIDFELAIIQVREHHSLIPQGILEKSAKALSISNFDLEDIASKTYLGGNAAIPFVAQAKKILPDELKPYFHQAVTSQDVIDTAMMMMIKPGLSIINEDLVAIMGACDKLIMEHSKTPMIGRTLLQHALPITFGVKVSQWASSLVFVIPKLTQIQKSGLYLQWGGPVGMSNEENEAYQIPQKVASVLGLESPSLPWHTNRQPIHDIASTLDALSGALENIAGDIALMCQSEVGEVSEPAIEGMGGSSSMPHKRNPVLCALIKTAAYRMHGHLSLISATTAQPFERSLGEWHASWMPLIESLALVAGATSNMKTLLEGLEVHSSRMADNLDLNSDAYLIKPLKQYFQNEEKISNAVDVASIQAHSQNNGFVKTLLRVLEEEGITLDVHSESLKSILDPLSYCKTSARQCESTRGLITETIQVLKMQ